jgi:hypothetical protein
MHKLLGFTLVLFIGIQAGTFSLPLSTSTANINYPIISANDANPISWSQPLYGTGLALGMTSSSRFSHLEGPTYESSIAEANYMIWLPLVKRASLENTYYVDGTQGSDTNPGTLARPWRTIQKAADTMLSGEKTIILAGTYNERIQVTRSGTAGGQITFQAQGTVVTKGFTIRAGYITIHGFEVTNTPNLPADGMGIFVEGSHCIIENNYVHYATRGGIIVYTDPGEDTLITDDIIRNNLLYRNSQFGIEIHGRNHVVEGNEISHSIQYHPGWINPPNYVDADGIRFFGMGHLIRWNYVHDITYTDAENVDPYIDCFVTYVVGPYYEAASNVVLEKNICKNAETISPGVGGLGFAIVGANHLIIRNNLVRAYNAVGAVNNSTLTIVNNVMASDLSLPIDHWPEGIYLENCTSITVKNNIFYNQPAHTYSLVNSSAGLDIGYNISYRNDGQSVWDSPYPHDLWGVNPLFVAPDAFNFHLQVSSPAIDAGINVGSTVLDDYDGNTRPQGPGYDMGAYEYIP